MGAHDHAHKMVKTLEGLKIYQIRFTLYLDGNQKLSILGCISKAASSYRKFQR